MRLEILLGRAQRRWRVRAEGRLPDTAPYQHIFRSEEGPLSRAMIRVVTVGTGTAAPHPHRVQSATVVEAGDVRLLVDCGSGSIWRMAALGVAWDQLTHVALTHFHADHTADL